MHGLYVTVNVQPGHQEEGLEFVKTNVIPLVKQAPGLVSGHWWSTQDGRGHSLLLFETVDAANGAAAMAKSSPQPDYASVDGIEVVEIAAQI
jgi:hypothetical protein